MIDASPSQPPLIAAHDLPRPRYEIRARIVDLANVAKMGATGQQRVAINSLANLCLMMEESIAGANLGIKGLG